MIEGNDERRLCATVFAASLLLYLSWRSLFFNFDGIACAIAVELSDFKHLVHGNHLAYGVLGWAFDHVWRLFGYHGRAILPLQVLDSILGAAGAAVFASILRRSGSRDLEAFLGAAALAVSNAWWFWSLEAQVYMLGALFAALTAREALADKPRAPLVGLWLACAALGHVGHLMAFPALAWLLARDGNRKTVASFAGTLAAVLLAAYAIAGLLAVKPKSFDEFRIWMLGSAALGVDRRFSWHFLPWAWAIPSWLQMTLRIFADFVGRSGATWAAGLLIGLLALIPVTCAVARGGNKSRFWIFWLAGYAVLFLNWEPSTIVYRVSDLIGLWALAAIGLRALPSRARAGLLAAWTAAAAIYNFAFTVRPAADPASNKALTEAKWLGATVEPNAWIVTQSLGAVYVPYFASLKTINLRYFKGQAALGAKLNEMIERGLPIYVTERTLQTTTLIARDRLETVSTSAGLRLYRVKSAASRSAKAGRS